MGEETPSNLQPEFWPVRGGIYMLAGYGANITASVGVDGVLLVDSGVAESSAAVLAALQRLEGRVAVGQRDRELLDERGAPAPSPRRAAEGSALARPVQYVIDTGPRPDHVGGNTVLASLAAPTAVPVIAHERTLLHLVNGGAPLESLPTHTLGSGQHDMTARFNGEAIRLTHMPAATTDGDLIVHFRGSDVISTGDVFSLTSFPVIDVDRGGSIDGCIRALNDILTLAVPDTGDDDGTLIIPGHGRLADAADVGRYRDMLTVIRDQVQHSIDSGSTLDEVQAQRPALGYEGRFGGRGARDTENFIAAVYRSLTRGRR